MVSFHIAGDELWKRMNRAVEKTQERLEKTAATLTAAQIPYADPVCMICGLSPAAIRCRSYRC